MKAFIISYLVSVIPLLYVVSPVSLEAAARICFYFGFPMAMALSLVIVAAGHLLGFGEDSRLAYAGIHRAADNAVHGPDRKVS